MNFLELPEVGLGVDYRELKAHEPLDPLVRDRNATATDVNHLTCVTTRFYG